MITNTTVLKIIEVLEELADQSTCYRKYMTQTARLPSEPGSRKMKLEELLQAIIDKNYPKGFLLNKGICANVNFLLGVSELNRFQKSIEALYKITLFPVAGIDEYNATLGFNMYESGLRANLCTRVLKYLKANKVKKFYIRVFKRKRYTEANPANHTEPANQGVET